MVETQRLVVMNHGDEPLGLVLEPAGEVYALPPGAERVVLLEGASPEQSLSVSVEKGYIKVWAEGQGPGFLAIEGGGHRRPPDVEGALRGAVRSCLKDPLEPPSGESVRAVLNALHDVLYVLWPTDSNGSPDGVLPAVIERRAGSLIVTGAVIMLYGGGSTSHRLRPLAADLRADSESTIQIGGQRDELAFESGSELRFADPRHIRWPHTLRVAGGG